jgi:hypothetical protein
MSFLKRIFGSDGRGHHEIRPENLGRHLRDLERKAKEAPLGTGWTFLNRAGDVCVKSGDIVRAVTYFGQAIDTLLEDEQPEPARGVAKKLIRVHPQAVRTLCTLTWLDLAARQPASAVLSLGEYAKAAARAGKEDLAADQVYTMARFTKDKAFLQEAAEVLTELDADGYAEKVHEWMEAGGSDDARGDPEALARFCISAAVGSNVLKKAEGAMA